jgi:hypothetical protein
MAVTFINSDRERIDLVFICSTDIIPRFGTISQPNILGSSYSDL